MSYRKYLMTDDVPPSELYKTVKIDTNSDTISRKAAIDALKNDMASLDHIIKGMSANDVRLDAYVSQRNQVNYDIYTINNLPPAQPEQLGTNLAEVGTDCISRQQAIDAIKSEKVEVFHELYDEAWNDALNGCIDVIEQLPPIQPDNGLQKLADEIASFKRCVKSENSDYLTGYLSALSVVEGMIADMREVTE